MAVTQAFGNEHTREISEPMRVASRAIEPRESGIL